MIDLIPKKIYVQINRVNCDREICCEIIQNTNRTLTRILTVWLGGLIFSNGALKRAPRDSTLGRRLRLQNTSHAVVQNLQYFILVQNMYLLQRIQLNQSVSVNKLNNQLLTFTTSESAHSNV